MLEDKKSRIFYISRRIGSYYAIKNYAVFKEVGLPQIGRRDRYGCKRADMICINSKDDIVILETKSSWEDYKRDKKWDYYLDWCNKFYFVASDDVAQRIKADLTNKDVGVISVDKRITFIKSAKYREPKMKAECITNIYKAIIFRASSFRSDGRINRYSPFFPPEFLSTTRLYK